MEVTKNVLDPKIAKAFGVNEKIQLLAGGIDLRTYRSGDVVLRNLSQAEEEIANWTANLFDLLTENGFRVARPIKARNGSWMVNGWVAEKFLEGQHATKKDLPAVIEAVNEFHAALAGAPVPPIRKDSLSKYQRADEWAWGEIPSTIDPQLYEAAMDLASLRKPVDLKNQVIHGDLNLNNILIAKNLPPAIIDLAPYVRPPGFALAVTAYWVGPFEGDMKVLEYFKNVKAFDQLLIRAGLRMMLIQNDPSHPKGLEKYKQVNKLIMKFVNS